LARFHQFWFDLSVLIDIPLEERSQPVHQNFVHPVQQKQPHLGPTSLRVPYFPSQNNGKENSKVYLDGEIQHQQKTEQTILSSGGVGESDVTCLSLNQISNNDNLVSTKSSESNQSENRSHSKAPNGDFDRFGMHDYEAPVESESNDGNSKSEDFGGEDEEEHGVERWEGGVEGIPGEGWEGAMFPFAEGVCSIT
jgi:hypothetical protein